MKTTLIALGYVFVLLMTIQMQQTVRAAALGNTTLPYGDPHQPGWPWGKVLGTMDAYNDFNNGTSYRGHCEDHGINGKTLSAGYCQGFNYGYDFEWHAVLGGEIP